MASPAGIATRLALVVGAQLLLPLPAVALTFSVQKTVTKLLDYPPPGISIALGDPVTGTFEIDPATANCAPGGACGTYAFTVGGVPLAGTLENGLVVDGTPPSQDALLLADEDPDVPGMGCSGTCLFSLEFRDPSGTALTSGDLEAALLALPTWPGTMLLDVGNYFTVQEIQVTFDAVSPAPEAIPVPALPLVWPLVASLCATGIWVAASRRDGPRSHT